MKKAFTLIELLVVIAIIAILAAILFPVFAQAKAAAKKTTSLSNFNQIGKASMMYMNDSDDVFPVRYWWIAGETPTPGVPTAAGRPSYLPISWRELVGPYVKNGIKKLDIGDWADGGIWDSPVRSNSYWVIDMHAALGTGNADGSWPFKPMAGTSLPHPADTAMIMEKGVSSGNSPWRNFEMHWWAWHNPLAWPPALKGDPNIREGDNDEWPNPSLPRYRHLGKQTTVSFVDGHSKMIQKGRFNWCSQIHVPGMDPDDGWLFDNGQPCEGVER